MKVQPITEQDIRGAKCRGYNPTEWDRTIDRFKKFGKLQFYKELDGPYPYERFFATYQVTEGLIFFKEVSYSVCITDRGFCRIEILEDGTIQKHLFNDGGKEGYAANTQHNRWILADYSKKYGHIFTTLL